MSATSLPERVSTMFGVWKPNSVFFVTVAIWQFFEAFPSKKLDGCHFEKGPLKERSRSNSHITTTVLASKYYALGPAKHDL